jgi:hypothetical protein
VLERRLGSDSGAAVGSFVAARLLGRCTANQNNKSFEYNYNININRWN